MRATFFSAGIAAICLATPVLAKGYAVSIDRGDLVTGEAGPQVSETVDVRGQNNSALSVGQVNGARDAGAAAACKPGEGKQITEVTFARGTVTLDVVCLGVDG